MQLERKYNNKKIADGKEVRRERKVKNKVKNEDRGENRKNKETEGIEREEGKNVLSLSLRSNNKNYHLL